MLRLILYQYSFYFPLTSKLIFYSKQPLVGEKPVLFKSFFVLKADHFLFAAVKQITFGNKYFLLLFYNLKEIIDNT